MLKKMICILLCLVTLCAAGCTAQKPAEDLTPDASEMYVPQAPQTATEEDAGEEETVYYSQDSEEYRELYGSNAIEDALDEQFNTAVTAEDFRELGQVYAAAWKEEYHALMAQLIELYPDDAADLEGLRDYTDDMAKEAYDAEYSRHIYIDENGQEQVAEAAEQNGNFALAEVYREATVLSILNDYREEEPYVFHYAAQ